MSQVEVPIIMQSVEANNNVTPFHSASLYVGDLSSNITETSLFEIFNQVGPVASIRVCREALTRNSLGYAYVNFHNVSDAERALDTMNFSPIHGIPCRIMWSQRDPSMRRSGVGNVFIKNLDESIDNKALYDTFSLFGNILSCKVASDENSMSKGYGYVHYETAESANEAIAKINGMEIAGKRVLVGHFVRRHERTGQADWTNIYIKNIPLGWDEERLSAEFSSFGMITSTKVQKDSTEHGLISRGFGFINFSEHSSAEKAVNEMNGKTVTGPIVRSLLDTLDDEAETQQEEIRELFCCRAQNKVERQRELQQKFEAVKVEKITKYQGSNLYIKNLDETVTEEVLIESFRLFGAITSSRIMKDSSTGRSRGFGFVCFSAPSEASKAIEEMNGKLIASKPIYVAIAQRKDVRRAQLEVQFSQRGILGPRMPMGAMHPSMYGMGVMPYMMASQPGTMPPRSGYPMTPQMMPVGTPRGAPLTPYQGRGVYPMPAYAMGASPLPPQQQRQPQRPASNVNGASSARVMGPASAIPQGMSAGPGVNGRGRFPQGMAVPPPQRSMMQVPTPQQGMIGGQNPLPGNYKLTQQVRNPSSHMPGMMPRPNAMIAPPSQPISLTAQALAAASPEVQKNMIGERLYPLIHNINSDFAGKITGMLLEMDNSELLHLLESPDSLKSKVHEALQVLQAHSVDA